MASNASSRSALASAAVATDPAGLCLSEHRGARLYHLEGARDRAPLAAVLANLGLPALPAIGRCAAAPAAQMLAIGPDMFMLAMQSSASDLVRAFAVVVDVSDGWTRIVVTGTNARDLLAQGCALDLHPRVFPPGTCAATGFAGLRTFLWHSAADRFDLLVGRSYARALWDWLLEAAAEFGVFAPARER
jgi:sarcosine oxidase subunit gamma